MTGEVDKGREVLERKRWRWRRPVSTAAVFLLLAVTLAMGMAVGLVGCGGNEASLGRTDVPQEGGGADGSGYLVPPTIQASEVAKDNAVEAAGEPSSDSIMSDESRYSSELAAGFDRKIISNANLQVEVEEGGFQIAFDQALLLADRYGGYIIASESYASEDEQAMRRGMIALRIPAESLSKALRDAGELGTVTSRRVDTQDVTAEFVDLKARLKNAEAQEKSLLELMSKAETVEDVLRVRGVLSNTQAEIEQIKGRLNYLEEHTDYSTLTVTLYEPGSPVGPQSDWGFMRAWRDAAQAFVSTVNTLIVGLGGALPVLAVFALVFWGLYRVAKPAVKRAQDQSSDRGKDTSKSSHAGEPTQDSATPSEKGDES